MSGSVDTDRGLLRRSGPPAPDRSVVRTSPLDAVWDWVSIAAYRLAPGDRVARAGDGDEVLVLALEGRIAIDIGSESFAGVGGRRSVFDDGPPGMVLAAPGLDVDLRAATDAYVVIASAPGGDPRSTRLIADADVPLETRGSGQTTRRIRHLLGPAATAGRLIAFEVVTPAGNWSSFPPHKHDRDDPPRETYLEEIYLYRFAGPTGFAVQRVYTADGSLDETIAARDGDLVLVPRGYHVVAAAPGYDCYYLNVMAGPRREWQFTVDPDHAWLMNWDPARPRTEE
jgi:5-deoxy-glucuronate isomerase